VELERALQTLKDGKIRFLRLQFTDIMGTNKNVEVPESQFEKALKGEVMFDGSSIEGFTRIEESDMLLKPDLDTLVILDKNQGIARVICDVRNPNGRPFEGCPRLALKRQIDEVKKMGYEAAFGCEAEFFLFEKCGEVIHDHGGYFDLVPADEGELIRREIVERLQKLDFEVEASHHEVAQGQHEIDFKYADPLKTADNLATFKFVVRQTAYDHGLVATFMPKPVNGVNGSGMHTHQSLFKDGVNVFDDPGGSYGLSELALNYIAGLLYHAKGMVAITNPTVNSYKRLVPGFEAPTRISWGPINRSPLIRIPAKRGNSARCELRMPDPAANPYLSIAVQLAAGLDGIKNGLAPDKAVDHNLFEDESGTFDELPSNLWEAMKCLDKNDVIVDAIGPHILMQFMKAKTAEWNAYASSVTDWEVKRFLGAM